MWMTSCTGSARGGFWKIQLSWELDTEWEWSTSRARWGQTYLCATGVAWVGGGRWKSQNRKNVYLSPYVEEPLNSKVIKIFVPELRNRKCFSCFGIPMFYVYMLWTFYERFPYSGMGMIHSDKSTREQISWWQCSRHYIWESSYTDYMCQEKKEIEDTPVLKIAWMNQYKNTGKQLIEQRKADCCDQLQQWQLKEKYNHCENEES